MTNRQEMVATLFLEETLNKVKRQFVEGNEILPIDSALSIFRLFKTAGANINLETYVILNAGMEGEQDWSYLGKVQIKKSIPFFKPIAFFTINGVSDKQSLEITILKEYESDLVLLKEKGLVPIDIKINKLTLIENAIIAAFSIEVCIEADKYIDTHMMSNGLNLEIWMSNGGFPQSFLSPKYGIEGPIGAYYLRGANQTLNPMIQYKEIYYRFYEMGLLTALRSK